MVCAIVKAQQYGMRGSPSNRDNGYLSLSPFQSEKALVEKFGYISSLGSDSVADIAYELDAGNGIADIVIYKLRKNWPNNSDIAKVPSQWSAFYMSLPYRKSFSADEAALLVSISTPTVLRVLRHFTNIGVCVKTKNRWFKARQPRKFVKNIVAIEAKLKDWRKALYQASRYLEFSHESWVLLDEYHSIPAISNIQEFQRRNIGLLTINNNGIIDIVHRPSPNQPKSKYRYWYACSEILKRNITEYNSSYTN